MRIRAIVRSVLMVAVAVGAVACSGGDVEVPEKVKIVLSAEIASSQEASRAGYLSSVGAHWDEGDQIALWMGKDNSNISLLQQSISDDGKRAVFVSEVVLLIYQAFLYVVKCLFS